MQSLILILHVLVAICLVALVLVQQGKGADIGASFGSGSANTMFGSVGPAPFLMKVTCTLAAIFFMTSLGMGIFAAHAPVDSGVQLLVPSSMQQPVTQPLQTAPVTTGN